MRPIEQIAIRTPNVDQQILIMNHLTADEEDPTPQWVIDVVHATHVYVFPGHSMAEPGEPFAVKLAFNYSLIPGKELELIQLLRGKSIQLTGAESGLSHFGYHIPDGASMLDELIRWKMKGFLCSQVSATT